MTEEVGRLLRLPRRDRRPATTARRRRPSSAVGARTAGCRFPSARRSTSTAARSSRRCCGRAAAQRVERYDEASGRLAETLRDAGYRAAVAAPVTRRRAGCGARSWRRPASEEPLPEGLERRLCDFADLVGQALANADAREKLAASRAELVEVGDAERRRLERNLHDGAQQRLVSAGAPAADGRRASSTSDPGGAQRASRRRTGRPRARRWRSCASSRAASTRRCSPSAGSARRSTRSLTRAPVPVEIDGAARRAPHGAGRGGRLLRRRGGDHERGEVRARHPTRR